MELLYTVVIGLIVLFSIIFYAHAISELSTSNKRNWIAGSITLIIGGICNFLIIIGFTLLIVLWFQQRHPIKEKFEPIQEILYRKLK